MKKGKKRLGKGEGTGQGCTAGRGHKGQKSRSGGNIPLWFEGGQMPIQRRLPKRGFKNIFKIRFRVVNLERIAEVKEDEFDITSMENHGLIKRAAKTSPTPVKVLADGCETLSRAITVRANAFSRKAKEIIESNGGKAEVV